MRERLGASGLPERLQGYRWISAQEYRDSKGRTVRNADREAITEAAFRRYQASLPEGVLGITPWNKKLAQLLREVSRAPTVRSWLIMGPVGSGKSTLVAATIAGLLGRGIECLYITEADLWGKMRAQWGSTSRRAAKIDVVQALIDVPVLALDDLGTIEHPKPWHTEGMERLVCGRYAAGRPMLITTNASLGELADTYGERVGSRLIDMIGRTKRYGRLGGPDWRSGRMRFDSAAVSESQAPQVCVTCDKAPCECPCPECGHYPCRGGGSCQ